MNAINEDIRTIPGEKGEKVYPAAYKITSIKGYLVTTKFMSTMTTAANPRAVKITIIKMVNSVT